MEKQSQRNKPLIFFAKSFNFFDIKFNIIIFVVLI